MLNSKTIESQFQKLDPDCPTLHPKLRKHAEGRVLHKCSRHAIAVGS